jgi:hypothetical protein
MFDSGASISSVVSRGSLYFIMVQGRNAMMMDVHQRTKRMKDLALTTLAEPSV